MLADPIEIDDRLRSLHVNDRARVTTSTFTDVLRQQHGEDIAAVVIHSARIYPDAPTAGYLDVPREQHVIRRKAVLRTARARRITTYAQSLIAESRLSEQERDAVLRCDEIPLGDLLMVENLRRQLLHWQVGIGAPYPGGRYLAEACRPGWPVISRHSLLSTEDHPIALVSEWWPQFNPHAVWH